MGYLGTSAFTFIFIDFKILTFVWSSCKSSSCSSLFEDVVLCPDARLLLNIPLLMRICISKVWKFRARRMLLFTLSYALNLMSIIPYIKWWLENDSQTMPNVLWFHKSVCFHFTILQNALQPTSKLSKFHFKFQLYYKKGKVGNWKNKGRVAWFAVVWTRKTIS